jgi:polyisoprenoid-binding protein YceI
LNIWESALFREDLINSEEISPQKAIALIMPFDINIDVDGINTGVEMRDKHLKSKDFFAGNEYPSIKFTGTSASKEKDGSYIFNGKLTIKDVTKEVSIPVILGGITKNKDGKEVMGLRQNS